MKKQAKGTASKTSTKQTAEAASASKKDKTFAANKAVFIKACKMAWTNYLEHLPAFTKLSSKFTSKMADDELKALKKLEKMMVANDLTNLRADVNEDMDAMVIAFKSGIWYIKEAFPGNTAKLKEAGMPTSAIFNYLNREKAMEFTTSLMAFLTKYKKELTANDNMPASFPQEFNELAKRLTGSLQSLAKAESSQTKMVEETDKQCLEHHKVVMKMMSAATNVIFKGDKELCKKFTLKYLDEQARVGNKTFIVGLVRLADDKKTPIKNASVTIQGQPSYSAMTNSAGRFKFEIEKLGVCKVKVKAPGYDTFIATKEIREGFRNVIEIFLTPIEQPMPVPPAKPSKKAAADVL